MKKLNKIIFPFILSFIAYYYFQSKLNLPYYDIYIARHLSSVAHLKKVIDGPGMDYLILGDSTCLHLFQPNKIQLPTENICLSGASSQDIYFTLKKIPITKIRKGLILSLSLNANVHLNKHLWERFISTGYYSLHELMDLYFISKEKDLYPSNELGLTSYLLKILSARLHLNAHSFQSISEYPKNYVERNLPRDFYEKEILTNKGYIRKLNKLQNKDFFEPYTDYYSKKFIVNKTEEYYLKKILEYAKKQRWKVVVFGPVLASEKLKLATFDFENGFNKYFKDIERTDLFFKYISLENNLNVEDFSDFNHPLSSGADKLSSQINKKIIEADLQLPRIAKSK